MKSILSSIILSGIIHVCIAQKQWVDSIRVHYHIPELAYAVISSDSIYELEVLGEKRYKSEYKAARNDKFRIGSNTKAITGFLAARLVKQGILSWNTKFFDVFPELKEGSQKAYRQLTLGNLLSFRTRLFAYTYTYDEPKQDQFSGTESEQRYQFAQWFFKQKPVNGKGTLHFSNLGYTAAALMMEKTSGKTYAQLLNGLGKELHIDFGFGAPNTSDSLQPWGHDKNLQPEAPFYNFKLNWLQAAGNIHVSLPDYIKFIHLQLQGLQGKSNLLNKDEFEHLFFGLPTFSIGWFWSTDEQGSKYAYNIGNPGTFYSMVQVWPSKDRAIIFFTNSQSEETETAIQIVAQKLNDQYVH